MHELLDLVLRVQSAGLYAEFLFEGEGKNASVYVRPKGIDSGYVLFEFFNFLDGAGDCQKCINGLKMILKKAQDAGTSKGQIENIS